jgi:hypothetical protein
MTTANSGDNFSKLNDVDLNLSDSVEVEGNSEPRLIISEEVKRLQQEPILPSSLLSKL